MSLTFLTSTIADKDHHVPLDGDWMEKIPEESDFTLYYKATGRDAPAIISLIGSDGETECTKKTNPFFALTKDNNVTFAGKEMFWSHKIRRQALQEGLEHHMPKLLYLMRPETAYAAALHYVAKEIGGAKTFLDQRSFIFQNPGISHVLENFWNKVQEIAWSAGFSPGITRKERSQLILALTECHTYSISRAESKHGEHSLLVPHLDLDLLNEAGIYFPSIQHAMGPTKDALKIIKDSSKRSAYVGAPSDISSYLVCHLCDTTADSWEEKKKHKKECKFSQLPTKCEGCGLAFQNPEAYEIHAYTFCRQGPLSGGKCATCGTKGPACLCQVHWRRTYELAAGIWEGSNTNAKWLTEEQCVPGMLILAGLYTGKQFIEEESAQQLRYMETPPTPIALPQNYWELDKVPLPRQVESEGSNLINVKNGSDATTRDLAEALTATLGCKLKNFKLPTANKENSVDSSTKAEASARKRVLLNNLLGTEGIQVADATEEDLDKISAKINEAKLRMTSSTDAKLFCATVGLTEEEVKDKIEVLEELLSNIGFHLMQKRLPPGIRDRREKLQFDDPFKLPVTRSPLNSPPGYRKNSEQARERHQQKGSRSKSPGERTGTSMRGNSKTHTIQLTLLRAMNMLRSTKVDPKATVYKRLYSDLTQALTEARAHLKYDKTSDVDDAYSDMLEELCEEAEELQNEVDTQGDKKMEEERAKEKERETLSKYMPRISTQKWDGNSNDYMRFLRQAKKIQEIIRDDKLALNAIMDTISDPKLKRRVSRHTTPAKALKDLELEFGNPELAGPKIINDMKGLSKAFTREAESKIIIDLKDLYASLREIEQEQLLGRNEIYNLIHLLRDRQGEKLLELLTQETDSERLRTIFFDELDSVYTHNTIFSRTELHKEKKPHSRDTKGPSKGRHQTKNMRVATGGAGNKSYSPTCHLCKMQHWTYRCKKLQNCDLPHLQSLGVCPSCLGRHQGKECWKTGSEYACQICKLHKGLTRLHTKCNGSFKAPQKEPNESAKRPSLPPPPVVNKGPQETKNHRVKVNRDFVWRSSGGPIANPNSIDSAFEMIDHVLIEGPDGQIKRIRVLHDTFGAPTSMADVNLESFSHRTGPLQLDVHTANTSTKLNTDELVLKLILPNGEPQFIKTIATDMRAQRAFKVSSKTIDVPLAWNAKYFANSTPQHCHNNGNLRFANLHEQDQIDLLLGSDNSHFSPLELERYKDSAGQCTLYRSQLQTDQLLIGGGRIVGPAVVPIGSSQQRSFQVTTGDGGSGSVTILRTAAHEMDATALFPENPLARMSKLDQKFFMEFEDNNLLPPHPRACKGCSECPTCSDISAVEKRKAIESRLDQLCKLNSVDSWPEGGWHISLLWNSLKSEVPTNKEDSIRRFLATERALLKSPEALTTFNDQVRKCLDLGYFVLEKDYQENLDGMQASYLPLSYALKDTVETKVEMPEKDEEPTVSSMTPEAVKITGKTKARPVSDGSHKANLRTPSVNEALVTIPDLWTGKIQNLLLKFRTARRLAMADISQYFHRLRLDLPSVSMTRAIWRHNGIGGQGELTTMFVPSASMGLTPVPALASHCRARTADLVDDKLARESLKESYCDDVYQPTLWEQTTNAKTRQPAETDDILLKRIKQVEAALKCAQLQLGAAGWVTDLPQKDLPNSAGSIKGVTDIMSHRDVGTSTTGALGLRWSLGASLPEGGTFSYRVHRPGSVNLLPKRRGKRPPEGELRNRADIKQFLEAKGITKAGLLSLVMNLFDVLQLAIPWTANAKMLYRAILTENPSLAWKDLVPSSYYRRIEDLASDLLTLSVKQNFPRRALEEGTDGSIGHTTLILVHDACDESACVLAYIHQQWPRESAVMPESVTNNQVGFDEDEITTSVNLLCGAHKLTSRGHEEQVAGELLSATLAVKLKKLIVEHALVSFDKVIYLGDSLTTARILRKSNRAFNLWAATRVSYVQRNENLDNMFHVPGAFLIPTADKGTRAHPTPSSLMDDAYWKGKGTVNRPLHLLPITPPSQYNSGLDDLPEKWLHKAALRLKPVTANIALTCNRIEIEEENALLKGLAHLKVKFRSFDKIKRIMMNILKLSPRHRSKNATELMAISQMKWLSMDHDIIKVNLKDARVPKTFIVKECQQNSFYIAVGRNGYQQPLIANPRRSMLSRVIMKQYHDQNHLSSPAMIQALLFKDFCVIGGTAPYLKKLEERCSRCKILRARPSEALCGDPPDGTQGPLDSDKSIWRRWMLDICGPLLLSPWVGKRVTRASNAQKTLKHWILMTVDLCSRQVDAVLLEGYSTSAVLTGMRELTGRHGNPQHIYWDRASNLYAAGALFKDENDPSDDGLDITAKHKVQEELQRSFEANGVTVHLSIPYSSHRQGRIEANIKRLKLQLVQLCYNEHLTKLTPLEATSLLSAACNKLNSRPLLLTTEASLEERHLMCPGYLTCADLDLQNTSCAQDTDTQNSFNTHDSALTKRATMVQERIENFRENFNAFMTKSLVSMGKFIKDYNTIKKDDVVLVLDKLNTSLPVQSKKRYVLGIVEEEITERSFKIRYIIPGTTTARWAERDIRGLSLIVRAEHAKSTNRHDVIIDPVFPGDMVQYENEQTERIKDLIPPENSFDTESELPNASMPNEETTPIQAKTPKIKAVTLQFADNVPLIQDICATKQKHPTKQKRKTKRR